MGTDSFPVFVQQSTGERTRVGTATREADGSFLLQLGDLVIGNAPAAPTRAPARSSPSASSGGLPTVFPNYGRSKGAAIAGASTQDLEFYANGARRSLNDPAKERFHDKERALLQAIEQELENQGGGGGGGRGSSGGASDGDYDGDNPPPPGDDDNIPF